MSDDESGAAANNGDQSFDVDHNNVSRIICSCSAIVKVYAFADASTAGVWRCSVSFAKNIMLA